MKVSLKFILATILLMLSYSIGGNAMDFASCVSKCESSCQLSESSSDINQFPKHHLIIIVYVESLK